MPGLVRTHPLGSRGLLLDLHGSLAPCTLSCVFCPVSLRSHRHPVPSRPRLVQEVLDEVAALLDAHAPGEVELVSDDVLAFPGLLDLVTLLRGRGVAVRVTTPGFRLADGRLARHLAGAGVRVHLTLWSRDPATAAAITGVPDALERLAAGLAAAQAAGVEVELGTVLTARNAHELADLAAWAGELGATTFTVRVFHPDIAAPTPAYVDQYPDYAEVVRGLARAVAAEGAPHLQVVNLPWCRVPLSLASAPGLRVLSAPNEERFHPWAACEACAVRAHCSGTHPVYAARHGEAPPDPAAAAAAWEAQCDRLR
ncbi:MAG: radical SAM protein [Alphaproteobacteria bacterium]|nr:radical SAM protein [Alphaproteobacteria bacterium]